MPYKNAEDRRKWAREYARRWRAKNPKRSSAMVMNTRDRLKHNARLKVDYAKRMGRLVPQPCEVCGASKSQAHHDDYAKPLIVRWLCPVHHSAADRGLLWEG